MSVRSLISAWKLVVSIACCAALPACSAIVRSVGPADLSSQTKGERIAAYSLPRGLVEIEVLRKGHLDTLNYVGTKIVPDTAKTYRFDYDSLWTASDDVKVTLTPSGLLDQLTITTEEQTDKIIVKLAQTAKEAIKLAAAVGSTRVSATDTPIRVFDAVFDPADGDPTRINCQLRLLHDAHCLEVQGEIDRENAKKKRAKVEEIYAQTQLDGELDPTRALALQTKFETARVASQTVVAPINERLFELEQISDMLSCAEHPFDHRQPNPCAEGSDAPVYSPPGALKIRVRPEESSGSQAGIRSDRCGEADRGEPGLYYRPPRSYIVEFTDAFGVPAENVVVTVPDRNRIFAVDLLRTPLVERVTTVEFENGMLQSVAVKKPSEGLEAVAVPYDVIAAFAELPAELVQLKLDFQGNQKALFDAQKEALESKKALLDYIEQSRKATETPVPGSGDPLAGGQ